MSAKTPLKKLNILFVCLGNICRSPSAEAIFRHQVEAAGLTAYFNIDSAGTGGWHVGNPPDKRAQAEGLRRGYAEITTLSARQLLAEDNQDFDYILTMDDSNYKDSSRIFNGETAKLHRFLDYANDYTLTEVPDPYYGGEQGFVTMFDLLENAAEGLLTHLKQQYAL